MTHATSLRLSQFALYGLAFAIIAVVFLAIVPDGSGFLQVGVASIMAVGFLALDIYRKSLAARVDRRYFSRGVNRILLDFSDLLKTSFTLFEFIDAAKNNLELRADASILFFRIDAADYIYNSSTALVSDPGFSALMRDRYRDSADGFYRLSEDFGLCSVPRDSRGFFLVSGPYRFFAFMKISSYADPSLFPPLMAEFSRFLERERTVTRMFEISALSKEWDLVAETQRSFLPKSFPVLEKLSFAAYFKPLVNVSGDYYDVIPVDPDRTLVVLGDVSGKGLASALIMGIIMNTIRVTERKDNLGVLVSNVDKAIKDMRFEDKYTVIFIGLIDTERKILSYVNASLADAVIVSRTVTGVRVVNLEPNCSLVGILPLAEIAVDEVPIRTGDIIALMSDGVTEATDKDGIQFGMSERYLRTLKKSVGLEAEGFVNEVSGMVATHTGNEKLRDDVTILAAKVGRLWD